MFISVKDRLDSIPRVVSKLNLSLAIKMSARKHKNDSDSDEYWH